VVVEFALVAPLLLMLVFGIIDFGWMIERSNVINNVTRDAARVASLDGRYADITSTATSELTDLGIGTGYTVSVTCDNTATADCANNATSYDTNAATGSRVTVTVSYNHHWLTPVGALCSFFGGGSCTGNTIQLVRTAEMVRE